MNDDEFLMNVFDETIRILAQEMNIWEKEVVIDFMARLFCDEETKLAVKFSYLVMAYKSLKKSNEVPDSWKKLLLDIAHNEDGDYKKAVGAYDPAA